jgi:hypothetical protein
MKISKKMRLLTTLQEAFPMWALKRKADVLYRAFEDEVAAARVTGNRNKYEEIGQRRHFEVSEYTDKLRSLRSRRLLAQAANFYIHMPNLKWEYGQWSWDGFLDEESESRLYHAVKEQKTQRRDYHLKLVTAATGLTGALIGLVAAFKR